MSDEKRALESCVSVVVEPLCCAEHHSEKTGSHLISAKTILVVIRPGLRSGKNLTRPLHRSTSHLLEVADHAAAYESVYTKEKNYLVRPHVSAETHTFDHREREKPSKKILKSRPIRSWHPHPIPKTLRVPSFARCNRTRFWGRTKQSSLDCSTRKLLEWSPLKV